MNDLQEYKTRIIWDMRRVNKEILELRRKVAEVDKLIELMKEEKRE